MVYDPVAELENIVTIDAGGALSSIGTLPATFQWFDQCFASPEQGRLYIRSYPNAGPAGGVLLVVDAPSGTLLGTTTPTVTPPLTSLYPIGVNAAGQVRALAWDPNTPIEHVLDLNAMTGVTTDLGTLPAAYQLFGDVVVDHPANRMYVDANGTLLTLDGASGALLGAAPISVTPLINANFLAANANGNFGLAWDATAQIEKVVNLNPATGVGVAVDSLPAEFTLFATSADYTTIDPSSQEILILDEATAPRIFKLRASTGAYLGQTPLQMNGFINPLCLFAH